MSDLLIRTENLVKTYQMGEIQVHALRAVSYTHLTLPTIYSV